MSAPRSERAAKAATAALAAWTAPVPVLPMVSSPRELLTAILPRFMYRGKIALVERFVVGALSRHGELIGSKLLTQGNDTICVVCPRQVFRWALAQPKAASVVVAHNHPAGDPYPSHNDRDVTRRLLEAGRILGIPVQDHLILGSGGRYFSFREAGSI